MSHKNKFDIVSVGARLREVRKTLRLTLDKLGEVTGLSVSGISEMESGNKKPSSVYMFGLAKAYSVNINWVLTGLGTMFAPDIELDLNFGEDNALVEELFYSLKNVDIARFEIMQHFARFKRENPDLIEEAMKEKNR